MGDGSGDARDGRPARRDVVHHRPELIVAIESRGFIFGAPVAASLGVGFVPVRKPGKLPYQTRQPRATTLEYGTDALEMHADAVVQRRRVWSSSTTCSRPAARRRRPSSWCASSAATSLGAAFVVELGLLGGARGSTAFRSKR